MRGSGNTIPQESGCLLYSGFVWLVAPTASAVGLSPTKIQIVGRPRYRGGQGQGHQVQSLWSGNDKGTAGVGVFVAEEWIEKVFEVQSL